MASSVLSSAGEALPRARVGEIAHETFSTPHPYPAGDAWTLEISENPVGCGDSRCAASGNTCSSAPAEGSCCGDLVCEGSEDAFNCEVDCGAPPFCGDALCDGSAGEDSCSCPADCGAAPGSELPNQTCDDGLDNDCGGGTDCQDSDCASDPSCSATCDPIGASCNANSDCCANKCRGPSGRKTCK